ncbi:MAG: DUF4339 domain-containing protein [Verrucomicrobiae bacterium]|nr:DUF4339 domain-containing protein [Verrucomicrobiae bacterium]
MSDPADPPEAGDTPPPGVRLRVRVNPTQADAESGSGPEYYLARDGEHVGPFRRAQLEAMLRTAQAEPHELAWTEGQSEWRPLNELFPGVRAVVNLPAGQRPDTGSAPRLTESFHSLLWDSFAYPFRGNGWVMLLTGTLFFAFLGVLSHYAMLLAWIPALLASGYLLATLQGVVQASGAGDTAPPDWPEVGNWSGDLLAPWFKWMVTLGVAFGPALVCFQIASSADGGMDWFQESATREQWFWLGAAVGLFLLGLAYFPMAILGVALSDSLGALSPVFVARSIAAVPGPYAVAGVVLFGLSFLQGAGYALATRVPVPLAEDLWGAFNSLYFGFVQARILGVLYWSQRERLGWF